jgi:hypothetical protein
MATPNGVAGMARRLLGSSSGGFVAVSLIPFLTGAMVASAVISLLRHEHPRLTAALRKQPEEAGDKSLEELIAEKEHLEDLIAETAAKQSRK